MRACVYRSDMPPRSPRGLAPTFLDDLSTGLLAPVRDRVLADRSLCLALRENYVNVYYRGGNLARISPGPGGYVAHFDERYFGDAPPPPIPRLLTSATDIGVWLAAVPLLKDTMDLWLGRYAKEEREFQQLLIRDNNFGGTAKASDYFICDLEYANDHGRFDFIAVHWPSTPSDRKRQRGRRLVLGELKCGDGALEGSAGLHAHVDDVNAHLADPAGLAALKAEMVTVFNQKRSLGLIPACEKDLLEFSDERPVLMLVLANHDPDKSRLRELLRTLPPSPHADLRIATACMFGYGLFDPAVLTVDEALVRFAGCI